MTKQTTRSWYDKLQVLAMTNLEKLPIGKELDDARFYLDAEHGNVVWIYHDKCASKEDTIRQYELAIDDILYLLESLPDAPSKEDVDKLFRKMEEYCTSSISATPGNSLYTELEQTFNSSINFIGNGRNAETLGTLLRDLNSAIQYEDAQMAEYSDAFFIDKDAEKVTWMYYNPDSNSGGQYVTNSISFSEILEAAEKHDNPEAFFDYLGSIAYQTIEDVGTVEFEAEKLAFLQEPNLKDATKDTMDSLIAIAKGGRMDE